MFKILGIYIFKGEAGTGNVAEAVKHAHLLNTQIKQLQEMSLDEKIRYSNLVGVPLDLVNQTSILGRLPVVTFAAGGIATPADAALMMQLGMDGVFVGSGIFKSSNPSQRAKSIADAVAYFDQPDVLARVSSNLGQAMEGACNKIKF